MEQIAYLIALQMVDGLGPIRLKLLLDFYDSPQKVWQAPHSELRNLKLPSPALKSLAEIKKTINPEKELEKVLKKGIQVVSIFDEAYPEQLKHIYNPPILLYFAGKWPDLNQAIGVVGTRKISGYGKTVTRSLTERLVDAGFTIISGLAKGVDTIAHQTTIDSGGKTVAVLGGGLNNIFPAENVTLAHTIAEKYGVVVSEYHPNTPSIPGNFPARNRIISGLSQAILVTEAARDSGSLITAKLGLEQGKQIYAVPGPINSFQSEGPHTLIRDGAKLVTKVEDILEDFGQLGSSKPERSVEALEDLEQKIIFELSKEKMHLDELTRILSQPPARIASSLLKLEIEGFVSSEGNGVYTKNLY